MKRINFLFFILLVGSVLIGFTSCDPDDESPAPGTPIVTLQNDDIDDNTIAASPGETINVTVNVEAPAGFNTLIIRKFVDGDEVAGFTQHIPRGATPEETFQHEFEYVVEEEDMGQEVYFTFEAVDENNNSNVQTLYVEAVQMPAARYTSVLLYSPLEDGQSQTFFSTSTGETYSMGEVLNSADPLSAEIDFGYFYGQNFEATLAAPSAYPLTDYGQANWVSRNDTRIGRTDITPGQFVEITDDNLDAINQAFDAATFGTNPSQVTNLEVGEILAFETDDAKTGGSKRGLIQVLSIEPGVESTGRIEIEVLVER